MSLFRLAGRVALLAPLLLCSPSAQAGIGDLLVAPTRIVLTGGRGTEIILNNIGDDVATYRLAQGVLRNEHGWLEQGMVGEARAR